MEGRSTAMTRFATWRRALVPVVAGGLVAALFVASPSQATLRGQNGRLVFEAPVGAYRQLFTILPDGTGLTQVTYFKDSGATDAGWSKDGSRIVFSKPGFGESGGISSNVFTMKTDGTDVVQLTHSKGGLVNDGADSWSPDGTKIAFASNRTGTYQIYTMNSDGTDVKQLTTGPDAHLAAWGTHP